MLSRRSTISSAHEQEVRDLGARGVRRLDAPFDLAQFQVEPNPRTARQRARLEDKFTITYVGRPDRRKGIEILISASERLAENHQDFQLLLVGYGFSHHDGRLEFGSGRYWFDTSALQRKGVRIELREAYNSAYAGLFYSASDVVVVPSLYEPMGYVVLEAMACAKPVVAARVGGITETIVDGKNGLLFEVGDADGLAQKLGTLYLDSDARQRLGQQARKDIEARRPLEDVVQDWQQLYRQAAFAFGESLYPSTDLQQKIRTKCEEANVQGRSSLGVYLAAVLGCDIASQIIAKHETDSPLPEGVPVNMALLRAIAVELQRALRRKGVSVEFSVAALSEVMSDLALAVLNRDSVRQGLCLRGDETNKRLRESWFQEVVGTPPIGSV